MKDAKEYIIKASVSKNKKIKYLIIIGILTLISIWGIGLMVYNLFNGDFLFSVYYLVGVILAISYIIIKLNIIFPTYIAADKKILYINNWENGFMPYDIYNKKGFIREFIPAKTKHAQVKLKDIKEVLVGSKSFVKRYCYENIVFLETIQKLEDVGNLKNKKSIRNMDLFCVITKQSGCYLIPISKFDEIELTKVLNYIEKKSGATIKCNNINIKRKRMALM